MTIPFFNATRQYKQTGKELRSATNRVLSSGRYILGEEVKKIEKDFAKYIGVSFGVGVNSGTDAIKIALKSLGIGPGNEVITVANTAVPTVSAIRETGATVVFVDVDKYFTLDADQLEEKITKRTKVIVPVHLYGQACDMNKIIKIARKHKIMVIEDCAQAIGTMYKKRKVGSFGDAGCFSFYPTKNLGACGDAGMILTKNRVVAASCKALRMYGMTTTYRAEKEGWNSRMDELQAAILRSKLPYLTKWNDRRIKIAHKYTSQISNPKLQLPEERKGTKHTFHLFVVRVGERQKFIKHLDKAGVGYGFHYAYPIHLQPAYKDNFRNIKLPRTEKNSGEIISIPIFPELTGVEVDKIIGVLNSF